MFKPLYDKVAFRRQRSHRIEELSDAVFAIVMTLLVLDIRLPLREITTEGQVWSSLTHTWPKILTFILSFSFMLTLGGEIWI